MNLDILIDNLKCPITFMIFRNPVTFEDGITYEYEAIKKWLLSSNLSPISKQVIKMNPQINPNFNLKNIIDKFKKQNLFDFELRYRKYNIYSEKFNLNKFNKFNNDNDKKNYLDIIDLDTSTTLGFNPIHFICRHSTPEIIQYIIDKGVNLECENING